MARVRVRARAGLWVPQVRLRLRGHEQLGLELGFGPVEMVQVAICCHPAENLIENEHRANPNPGHLNYKRGQDIIYSVFELARRND